MADALARVRALEVAFNSGDVDKVMEYFAEDSTFSDFMLGISDLNKEQTREFYGALIADNKGVKFTTRHASGSDDLLAWEVDISFVAGEAIPALGIAEGEHVVFQGVSLIWWKEDKIVKERDYYILLSHK